MRTSTPSAAVPTVEDTGTAQLAGGAAAVRLDPTFAASSHATSGYRVLSRRTVTPTGSSSPLRTPNGFIVRESQGGRSTVAFDYRIVATAAGQANVRMAVMGPAVRGVEPKAAPAALLEAAAPAAVLRPAAIPAPEPPTP